MPALPQAADGTAVCTIQQVAPKGRAPGSPQGQRGLFTIESGIESKAAAAAGFAQPGAAAGAVPAKRYSAAQRPLSSGSSGGSAAAAGGDSRWAC